MKTCIDKLSVVVLSHLHYDHIADIGILQYAMAGALRTKKVTDRIKVFAPEEPIKIWEQIQADQTKFIPINSLKSIQAAGATVSFCPVTHTIPCYAVKIEYYGRIFVYSADTAYDENLIKFAENADLFICEATISEGSVHTVGKGHMDAKDAGMIARKAQVQTLVLSHLPHDGDFTLMKEIASNAFGKEAFVALEHDSFILKEQNN